MKHFKNSNILFKLIISFILCCLVFSGMISFAAKENGPEKCDQHGKEQEEDRIYNCI